MPGLVDASRRQLAAEARRAGREHDELHGDAGALPCEKGASGEIPQGDVHRDGVLRRPGDRALQHPRRQHVHRRDVRRDGSDVPIRILRQLHKAGGVESRVRHDVLHDLVHRDDDGVLSGGDGKLRHEAAEGEAPRRYPRGGHDNEQDEEGAPRSAGGLPPATVIRHTITPVTVCGGRG